MQHQGRYLGKLKRLNNFATSGTRAVYAIVQELLNDEKRSAILTVDARDASRDEMDFVSTHCASHTGLFVVMQLSGLLSFILVADLGFSQSSSGRAS